jgi:hypothetical protein
VEVALRGVVLWSQRLVLRALRRHGLLSEALVHNKRNLKLKERRGLRNQKLTS